MTEPAKSDIRAPRPLVLIGGAGLLTVVAVDLAAVLGRHLGMPFLGSIELAQAAILIAALSSMVIATLTGAHATVRILLDRAGPGTAVWIHRVNAGLAALFFAALLAGSVILAADLWRGHEESEIIGIPYRVLRVFTVACAAGLLLIALRGVFTRRRP